MSVRSCFLMVRRLSVAALSLLLGTPSHADVHVTPIYVTAPSVQQYEVPANRALVIPLPGGQLGDRYRAEIAVVGGQFNDLSAYILDEHNRRLFDAGRGFYGDLRVREHTPFALTSEARQSGPHYLVLDNRYAAFIGKRVSVRMGMAKTMSPELVAATKSAFESFYDAIRRDLDFPAFDIHVKPCGMVNAFSHRNSGDITICTETIAQLARKPGTLQGIMAHEGVLSRNRRKFRQPINVACPAPGRWGGPNSRVTSRHFDHGNASRTSRPDCSGLDEAD